MAHRTIWLLLAVAVCVAVGADAQCSLTVQDQPQFLVSCPGDNYTCAPGSQIPPVVDTLLRKHPAGRCEVGAIVCSCMLLVPASSPPRFAVGRKHCVPTHLLPHCCMLNKQHAKVTPSAGARLQGQHPLLQCRHRAMQRSRRGAANPITRSQPLCAAHRVMRPLRMLSRSLASNLPCGLAWHTEEFPERCGYGLNVAPSTTTGAVVPIRYCACR